MITGTFFDKTITFWDLVYDFKKVLLLLQNFLNKFYLIFNFFNLKKN
jgi:hypothetical protein